MQVLGYVRVSTDEQSVSGLGLEAQRQAIVAECKRRGWHLIEVIEDAGWSARDLRRPGIKAALDGLESGEAQALVVAKLDRLSRSLLDFAGLMATTQQQGWGVIALDVQVDTSTASGEAMANMLATFAQFERRLIGQPTKEALAIKKAGGVKLGRPPAVPRAIVGRIERLRARGLSFRAIADELNQGGVPTAQGGARWYAATVRDILLRTS
jgi:DNA invertase Pin-like site-specific DNA recombinase